MEELKKQIESWLKDRKFMYHKDPEKGLEGWYKIWWTPGTTQTIIINGERQDVINPADQHAVVFSWGAEPGYVSDSDGGNKHEFLQCYFMYLAVPGGNTDNKQHQSLNINVYNLNDVITLLAPFTNNEN